MSNRKKLFVILVFLIIITGVIIWLVIFSMDNNIITPYKDGTQVGYVYIGGRNTSQAENDLATAIRKWRDSKYVLNGETINGPMIVLSYQDDSYRLYLDHTKFNFDVGRSIQRVQDGRQMDYAAGVNIIYVTVEAGYIEDLIKNDKYIKFTEFNYDALEKEVIKYVSFLFKEIYIDIGQFIDESASQENYLHQVKINYPDASHFVTYKFNHYFGDMIEIKPKTQFSLADLIIQAFNEKPFIETKYDENDRLKAYETIINNYLTQTELSIFATGIFKTILNTNFVNIERHYSSYLPEVFTPQNDYIGYEALVELDYTFYDTTRTNPTTHQQETYITGVTFSKLKDLTFYNPNRHSYYIKVSNAVENGINVLVFSLYGPPFVNEYGYVRYAGDFGTSNAFEIFTKVGASRNGYRTKLYRTVKYYDKDIIFITAEFEYIYMPK
ncbi:MAG: hypothetical protein GX490_07200 [Bacilli bacterium]|nr:hypothetical protein [Bacilli bacterium]